MTQRHPRVLAALAICFAAATSHATVFYYDPESGNVALDTSSAPEETIWGFGLGINKQLSDLRFLPENYVTLTGTFYNTTTESLVGEIPLTSPISGYFTIGDILPSGISETDWETTFSSSYYLDPRYDDELDPGFHFVNSCQFGCGSVGDLEAEFVYGLPDRPFDNRWDIVDPDDLQWAQSGTLIYNPLSGGVTLDTTGDTGGHIVLFLLESQGRFLPDNFAPGIESPATTATADTIGLATDAIEPGIYDIGSILQPGLTIEEVEASFTSARFVGRAGFGGGNFEIENDGIDLAFALATTVPGDANGDMVVDLLDLDILGRNFDLSPASQSDGDFNGDGTVDLLDLDLMGGPFTTIQDGAGSTPIPEPATILLLTLAAAGAAVRRRA